MFTNKNVKNFKVVNYRYEPVIQYMPTNKEQRKLVYNKFKKMDIILPPYNDINFDKLFAQEDLLILCDDFDIIFKFKGIFYHIRIKKGLFFDGASVPHFLVHGKLSRINYYSLHAALVHDLLYATKLFPRNEADDIFEGLLRYKNTPKLLTLEYMIGLRLGGWISYNRDDSERRQWFSDFSEIDVLSSDPYFEELIRKGNDTFYYALSEKP